jgi:hypothetical protein
MQTKEKIDLESKYSQKIQQLFELGRESLMNREIPSNEAFQFNKEDIPELIKLATDYTYEDIDYTKYEIFGDRLFYATIHALNILGKLKAVESIASTLQKMDEDEGDNEFFNEALITYIGNMGSDGLDSFEEYIFKNPESYELLSVIDGIDKILEKEPSTVNRIEEIMIRYLKNVKTHPVPLSFAISTLIDIGEDKHIDLIRETFKTKEVDALLRGNLEEIEIDLGLREDRRIKGIVDKLDLLTTPEVSNPLVNTEDKIGRNDPCPCGSGKKYKKCCINK